MLNEVLLVMVLLLRIISVKEIQKGDAETTIVFENGERVRVARTQNDHDYFVKTAQKALDRKLPVGAAVAKDEKGESRLADIARVESDTPTVVTAREKRIEVRFQLHDGTFSLERDHPDFERLSGVLEKARAGKTSVWFVFGKNAAI